MNKSSLLMQQEEIRNQKVYDPSQELRLIADVIAPIVKATTKSSGAIKKSLSHRVQKVDLNRSNSYKPKVYTSNDFTPKNNSVYPAGYKTYKRG